MGDLIRLQRKKTLTAGAGKSFFNGYSFAKRVKIVNVLIAVADEENAGFIIYYYSYDPGSVQASAIIRARAEGRSAYSEKQLIIEGDETLTLGLSHAKVAGEAQCTLIFEEID